ncbi:hypothetical protein DFJ63DRAFT_335810 [Scheffersomyces coipomensis]|uniref:uncharacterized protein n=1 Tax=Scheffersomyces coipomensis TaxID=1788519 RepID=UPI00315CBA7B
MSNNPNHDDSLVSSSEDEDNQPTQSNIRLPNLNLHNYRKQHQRQSSRQNISKAGKMLSDTGKSILTGTGKSVRFPDSYSPRNPRESMISNRTSNDSRDEEMDENDQYDDDNIDPNDNLPSFKFRNFQGIPNPDSDDEGPNDDRIEYEYDNESGLPQNLSDSSDDEEDKDNRHGDAVDITDQINRKDSKHSITSVEVNEDKKATGGGGIKGILRKMSLIDRSTDPEMSPSDTFLGRVLNASNNGLSGGGLTPGASKISDEYNKEPDAEQRIGFEDPIELKRMDFDSLNEEAQNLISAHVPEYRDRHVIRESSSSSNDQINHEDKVNESEHRPHQDSFFTSNLNNNLETSYYDPNEPDFLLDSNDGYIAPPNKVHAGVLSSLLKLYNHEDQSRSTSSFATTFTDGGTIADDSIYGEGLSETRTQSTLDFSKLKHGFMSGQRKVTDNLLGKHKHSSSTEDDQQSYDEKLPSFQNAKPRQPPKKPQRSKKIKNKKREQKLKITVHIADILQRQRFIMQMCRALMLFGAPTHRLEEYMLMTSRVLEIDGQFMYFPGCMIVSFGDAATRTSEVHLVRCVQGLNLSKLSDAHKIYKGVIHDIMGVDVAAAKLDALLKSKNLYPPYICVLIFGLGAATVAPFAFGGGWIDVPILFGLGCCVGFLQFYLSSMSNLYSSVFEVTASIVVSFIARGIGSIRGGNLFCFAAIVQGSLALILPGYIILCGSLELQSRNIVAGSVRMFYAIIYSLFLGFGITLGAALYGWVDSNATSANTCAEGHPVNDKWRILFVPGFSLSLALINQARWQQLPVMLVISGGGYVASYFAGKHFANVTEFTSCIGAFIVGILGNLYSRIWKGMAVSAMLPAIFVQVPSGIASKGSLIAGVATADQITKGNSTSSTATTNDLGSLDFGATMVEVSIGISVGLFAAALVVYPFGKKRTGLFTL